MTLFPLRLGLPEGVDEPGLAGRLSWVTGIRLGFITLLLGLTQAFYLHAGFAGDSFSVRLVLLTLGSAYALAGAYAAVLRRGRHLEGLALTQVVFDQITWTFLVYVSGGATSGATAFYGLTCLTGAILVGLRGAAVAALCGTACFSLLCLGFATGSLPTPPDQPSEAYAASGSQLVFAYAVNLLVIMVVMMLGGYLAERLRLAGGRLVEATRRAQEAERLAAIGRLAAGMAHEIRNPLGSILGCVQILGSSEAMDAESRELCGIVERETVRLNDLVTDMLELSRPRKPVIGAADLARTAREIVQLATRSGRGSDVTVRYDGPDELVVQADAGQLRQVVWNLVRNAVQVNGPGAPVTVRVTAPDEAEPARLEVVDEGPGIPPAARDRLFDAFFTTRSSGIGIGLAVVKRIVDDHGWSIDVESETGQGATFRVRLTSPLVRAPSASRTSLLPARAFRSVPPPKPGHPKSVPPRAAATSETDPPPSVDRMGSKPV